MPINKPSQSGFALVLALLALLLLTSLGLSLSTTTSTESQIATNHRWTESARYNAEAGLEYAKRYLAGSNVTWDSVVPDPARVSPWAANFVPSGPPFAVANSRDFEGYSCDSRGSGMGYGRVLVAGGAPLQFMTTVPGVTFTLNGAFTVWVRRPIQWVANPSNATGAFQDYNGNDVLVLVSEGVAPYTGAANASTLAITNRATYVLETVVSRAGSGAPCEGRTGQSGGSAQGTNSWGCISLGEVGSGIRNISGAGTGTEK